MSIKYIATTGYIYIYINIYIYIYASFCSLCFEQFRPSEQGCFFSNWGREADCTGEADQHQGSRSAMGWAPDGTGDRITGGFSISWPMQPWCHDFKMGPKPIWPYHRKLINGLMKISTKTILFIFGMHHLNCTFFFITKSIDLITARFACADSSQRALFKYVLVFSFLFKRMKHPIIFFTL